MRFLERSNHSGAFFNDLLTAGSQCAYPFQSNAAILINPGDNPVLDETGARRSAMDISWSIRYESSVSEFARWRLTHEDLSLR